MMFERVLYLFGIFVLGLLHPISGYGEELTIQTHNSGEQSYINQNGELRGKPESGTRAFYIELVREIMKDLKYREIKISNVPFKRGYLETQRNPDHAIFNIALNDQRKPLFRWVGPIWTFKDYFIRPSGSSLVPKSLDDAKNMRVCVVRGNIHDQELSDKGFQNLIRKNNYVDCIKMLARKQADLTVSALTTLSDKVANAGVKSSLIEVTDVLVSTHAGYIAFSKQVPDNIINRWQVALDTIKQDGRYEQLQKKYIKETSFKIR